ncbi:hypothetical protein ABK040_012598 [Willaertia magna]
MLLTNNSFTFSYTQTKDEMKEMKEKFQQVFTKELNETLSIQFNSFYNRISLHCKPTEKTCQFTISLPSFQSFKKFKNFIKFTIIDISKEDHLLLFSIQFNNRLEIILLGRLKLKKSKSLFFCHLNEVLFPQNKQKLNELTNENNTIKKMMKEINKLRYPKLLNNNVHNNHLYSNEYNNDSYFDFIKKIKQITLNNYLVPCRVIGEEIYFMGYTVNKQFRMEGNVIISAENGSENGSFLRGEIKVKNGLFFTKKTLNNWHLLVTVNIFTDQLFIDANN